jgi:hypothetical protein
MCRSRKNAQNINWIMIHAANSDRIAHSFISLSPFLSPLSISLPISISPAISFFLAILSPSVWQQTEIIQKGEAQ